MRLQHVAAVLVVLVRRKMVISLNDTFRAARLVGDSLPLPRRIAIVF